MKQIEYYQVLLSALIDNHYEIGGCTRTARVGGDSRAGPPYYADQTSDQTGWHGKKKHLQSRCRLCGLKTVYVCNYCRLKPDFGESGAAFCNPITGRTCYATHMNQEH
jgi:hypothetical protein